MSWHRCPNISYLDVSETRVTSSGVTLFLACHQNVVCIDHEETFHILALVSMLSDLDSVIQFFATIQNP